MNTNIGVLDCAIPTVPKALTVCLVKLFIKFLLSFLSDHCQLYKSYFKSDFYYKH